MTVRPFRGIDLSDRQAQWYCLACGNRFIRQAALCPSCGKGQLVTRQRILNLLHASAPEVPLLDLDSADLRLLPATEKDELPSVRTHLVSEKIPFLLVDERSEVLHPTTAESAMSVLVPAARLAAIQSKLFEWLVSANDHAVSLLCSVATDVDLAHVRGVLDKERIPYFIKQFARQFGIIEGGELGTARVYVYHVHLEQARKALGEEGEATPTPDDLEGMRFERRYRIARYYTFLPAAILLTVAFLVSGLGHPGVSFFLAAPAITLLGLISWSRTQPEKAFGTLLLLNVGFLLLAVVTRIPLGRWSLGLKFSTVVSEIVYMAILYFAYAASVQAGRLRQAISKANHSPTESEES